jgi:formamidopyrimidine-DNA glycosylase
LASGQQADTEHLEGNMPELPEVETTVRSLRQPLLGQTFTGVRNQWPRHIATPDLQELQARIQGQRIETINRRGKYLVFTLSKGDSLLIHLKMSGHLSVLDRRAPLSKHVHTVFELASGRELRFRDPRKFGRVYLVSDPERILGKLGPEPLEHSFTANVLQERLQGRKRVIKPLLLDQSFIAGVGNIYANEALFYARIHPERRSDSLTLEETKALHRAIRKSLNLGLANQGASIDQYRKPDGSLGTMQNEFVVHNREEQPCVRCYGIVQRMVLGGRSTYFCPECQL